MPRGSKCKYFPPQKNNNNERTEFIDDSMICDEWVDVTDKYVLKNTPTTLPVANENPPPKSDTSCSEIGLFNSPRNKKRKLKMPLTFDEIVVKLNFNTLNSKFVKLLQFLESGNDEMFFPSLTKQYEDFFKMIVQDINILKSRSLDTYRDVCDKIIEVASFKNSGYLLTYNYDYRMEFKNTVLVIKKVYTKSPMNVEESSSSKSDQPSPLPEMEPVQPAKRFKDSISNGFKIHCLRTALAFVKNNVTVNVEFPELSSEQAEFMQLLLESVITFADCGNDIEVNELYRALWEAVKIHSTKYDFRINTVDSYGEKKKPQLKPKAQRKLTKIKNRSAFIYRLPRTFVYNAFETVIEFLADDKRLKMIVFPTNEDEVVFYRKCIEWTGPEHAGIFDGEYKPYYDKIVEYLTYIKCEVSKSSKQGYYKISGIREVTYTKKPKLLPNGKPVVKPPNLPKPDQIEFKVPTVYTSLRNKKKNKKLKKKNLVKVKTPKNKKSVVGVSENRISVKYSDTSSEISSSSRDASQERKVQPTKKAKKIKKALPKETEITPRAPICNSKMTRWQSETARKEQLKEALSVPVQSDKAMKMMLSMGWSGGALGARGNGITEPIMPALDIPKGYGFGAYKITPQSEISKKPEIPKTVTVWSTDTNEDRQTRSENDIIVEKTKELLLEKPCFDKLMKGLVGRPKTDPEIIDLDEYPDTDNTTNVGRNVTKTAPKVKMSKAERKAKNKKSKAKVPTQTRHSALLTQNPGSDVKFEPRKFRGEVLETVLELLITDTESKTLSYDIPITQKNKQYITHLLKHLKYRTNVLVAWNQQCLADEIVERYKELPDVIVESYFSDNRLEVELKKIKISTLDRDSNEIIFDKDVSEVSEYIRGTSFKCDTRKALDNLKFKVLILMKILELVKSNNEDIEIVFNKVLPKKRKNYIANLLDSFNLRQKLGDTEPEMKLSDEIRLNIRNVFLSHMFNHEFNGVTINKNFKRVIDVDNYTKKRTDKPTAKELAEMADYDITDSDYDVSGNDNDVTGNSYDVSGDGNDVSGNDNDNTDDESLDLSAEDEDNTKITGKVLPPRDETVSMYEYLYMYDPSTYSKQNKNTAIDIVIDKNDNQVIDMKNVDGQSKSMDVDEEEAENAEVDKEEIMLIDDFESEEIKFSEKFFGDKPVDVNEDCDKKTNNNIDDMIYEVLLNTETSDEKPIVNISKSQVTNNLDIENEDETMREADLDNQTQENHEKEEFIEVINDESSKEISEKSSRIDDEEIIKRIDDIIKQENETDCDISFDKDDLVLSEENCDNQPLNVSHSETGHMENGVDATDMKNTEVNHVYIVSTHYPTEIITKEKAKEIQEIISEQIMLSKELPLLKCHGVQNGALIYTCHNKISFDFLENSIKDIGDLKVLNTVNVDKMAVKLFCLFDFDSVYLFNMIELYNKEISTKQWVVEKREFRDGYTIFVIKMDKESIDFIHSSDLALFAGVDKVEFSLIWE
uniref:G-patch domain-containing protein n=1 Tax=Heliothis virescens TaxID=7102 RepID=A0A2A4JRY9_HELVI